MIFIINCGPFQNAIVITRTLVFIRFIVSLYTQESLIKSLGIFPDNLVKLHEELIKGAKVEEIALF